MSYLSEYIIPVVKHLADSADGASLLVINGQSPTSGYVVAIPEHGKIIDQAEARELYGVKGGDNWGARLEVASWVLDMIPVVDSHATPITLTLGSWRHEGKLYLDLGQVYADRDAAIAAGIERNQIAIWDVAKGEEIPTGGTGQ